MMKFSWIVCYILSCQITFSLANEGQCIDGPYHKPSPSPETNEFKTCHAYKDNSCCTAEFTVELVANETKNLYNHSWHRCGQLSEKCQQFWVKQECFYQCSPYVYKYAIPNVKGAITGVPVCSGFCDEWYEACKMDQICVENILEDYNFTSNGENFCPSDKNCTTYELMYGNGKNLCEKMWASSYIYTQPNADYSNCLMMNGSIPHNATLMMNESMSHTTTPGEKPTVAKGFSLTAWTLLVILMALAVMQ
ncbi:PREDICTED: riboflavin-binding protein-like isoform X1 [Acropora digitifera]|uniref:riboflavin-binding protein-like isoform X1 n=1 Tax=Acropora digitifera TaxID=70779 RepID=UPI00077A2D56|nr:PREDICTED: riboflavin-binding protein-like isoform X1 [Acropora digitifera]